MAGITDHEATIAAIVTSTGIILGALVRVVKVGRRIATAIDRLGDDVQDFRGRPADPDRGIVARPGVMAQLADLYAMATRHDLGQIEILRRIGLLERPTGRHRAA